MNRRLNKNQHVWIYRMSVITLGLFRAVGDRQGEANTLKSIGDVQQYRKEMDAALASYDQALGQYRARPTWWLARATCCRQGAPGITKLLKTIRGRTLIKTQPLHRGGVRRY